MTFAPAGARPRRRVLLGLAWLLWTLPGQGIAATPPAAAAWEREIRDITDAEGQEQARWGIHVVSLDTGSELLAINAGALFIPASNTKLFTGALALHRLGAEFRIRTSFYARQAPNARGTLESDLVLFGRGDPSFSARFRDGWIDQALTPLLDALESSGIRRIEGRLITDESFFLSPALGSGWEWDDLQYGYGTEVGALNVHDNTVKVHVRPGSAPEREARVFLEPATTAVQIESQARTGVPGSARTLRVVRPMNENRLLIAGSLPLNDPGFTETVAVHRPGQWLGELLGQALAARGIRIRGGWQHQDAISRALAPLSPGSWEEVAYVNSPPLRELLAAMLRPSQNQYAQLLLLQVGALESGAVAEFGEPLTLDRAMAESAADADGTTEAAGLRALHRFLEEANIPTSEVLLEEGSGLSRRHLVSPRSITRLLAFMDRQPEGEIFRHALPAPGEPGTLRNRLTGLGGEDRLRAKTGYVRYSYALSGYLRSSADERLAFSILLNNANRQPGQPSPRVAVDRIAEKLAAVSWKSEAPTQ